MTSLLRTGVGSLPHEEPAAAVEFVMATAEVPYLPQLPNRHPEESMLLQWGDGIAGSGPDGRALGAGRPPGDRIEAFGGAAAMLSSLPPGGVIKTQATGPVTLAAALAAGGASRAGLLHVVTADLVVRIKDHVDWIRQEAAPDSLVVVVDEPALIAAGPGGLPGNAAVFAALGEVIDAIDAEVGVHCCGDTNWGAVADLRPDWLSWDLAALGPGFQQGVDKIAEALGAGTRVSWGVVPTTSGPLPDQNVLLERYGTAVANLVVAGAPIESLQSRAWFTPACGLAGLTIGDAEAVGKLLEMVVGEIEHGW